MKYFFIAGEKSGDLHGGNLIQALSSMDENANFFGIGGDNMKAAGMQLSQHYRTMAFMGVWEVIKHLGTIRKNIKKCQRDILEYQPDVVVLIDYGGFNMKIAKFCKSNEIRNFYYISPKVWAWNTKRAFKIKKYVDRLYCILPFEKKFFQAFNYEVDYVGNPVVDAITTYALDQNKTKHMLEASKGKKIVAVLPGSRKQEVERMLSVFDGVRRLNPEYFFIVAGVDNLPNSVYSDFEAYERGMVVYNQTYELLSVATGALVCSGTATLETALWNVPQIVAYKTSTLTFLLAKLLLKVPYISLVNLIANKEVVPELVQSKSTSAHIARQLKSIVEEGGEREGMLLSYRAIAETLGRESVSEKTATLMLERLKHTKKPA